MDTVSNPVADEPLDKPPPELYDDGVPTTPAQQEAAAWFGQTFQLTLCGKRMGAEKAKALIVASLVLTAAAISLAVFEVNAGGSPPPPPAAGGPPPPVGGGPPPPSPPPPGSTTTYATPGKGSSNAACPSQARGTLGGTKGNGAVGTCTFPFTYSGTTYTSCADAPSYGGVGWCAWDTNYVSKRWGYCTPSCPGYRGTLSSDALFISEAAEGTSMNRFFEVFNPLPTQVDLSTYAFAIKVNNPGSTGPMKQLIHEPGVTCSQHAKDPHWGGNCTQLNNGQPGWGGGKGLHIAGQQGWVEYHFARTKYVMSVTVHQLDHGYTTPSFQIQALAAGTTSQWDIIKVYAGDAKPLQKYVVLGGGVRADAIRIEMTGKPPKDNWARLQQVYVRGQDAKGAGVPDHAPYDFWYPFNEHAVISPGGVYVVCHEGADPQILQSCDQRAAQMSSGDDGICLVKGSQQSFSKVDCVGSWQDGPGQGARPGDYQVDGKPKPLISELGVTCTQHARDPHWGGVSSTFSSLMRSILTQLYQCHACA
jgi:hypothetical protein